MKREHEKIKDLVEPQTHEPLQDFSSDPERALATYRVTDITADLLAKWLDALADLPRGRGGARALAGVRGVGKSHTLAAFGAIAAFPELRSGLSDSHIATSARRLLNRRYLVAHIERGTRATLTEELAAALANTFGGSEADWIGSPDKILSVASSRAGDQVLVLIIDTAFERATRVQRNDGLFLSELATAADSKDVFIALALDDDISWADGANVSLAGTFPIDYLDSEHLYRIADLHVLKKKPNGRQTLHDVYMHLHDRIAGFNWSEPRFTLIYPIHPIVADISSAVRLYSPGFAFLPFAASAATRALNRPAESLVVLDEVFDRTEFQLRKSSELKEAFALYDHLSMEAITQFPLAQRLEAKLLLKALFILSLDGRGASARELGAAMLIYDVKQPEGAIARIGKLLERFAAVDFNSQLSRIDDATETRYQFEISTSAALEKTLTTRVQTSPPDLDLVNDVLCSVGRSRFQDWPLVKADGELSKEADALAVWRGTYRHGRVSWIGEETPRVEAVVDALAYDWSITILAPRMASSDEVKSALPSKSDLISCIWIPSSITQDEFQTLQKLIVLRGDPSLAVEFGDKVGAAERLYLARAERIWTRLFLDEGTLVIRGKPCRFTTEALGSSTLSAAVGVMLEPVFDSYYPEHPDFTDLLGENEVTRLVAGWFGGSNQTDLQIQKLADMFAAPLGLASLRGETYAPVSGDDLLRQPWVREVLAITDDAGGESISLDAVNQKLKAPPLGLAREAQNLVLAALVASRRIEFVTAAGDRIGRRTLDLKLRWDEICGIARAAALQLSAEELSAWARTLIGNPGLGLISNPSDREVVREQLAIWLDDFRRTDPSSAFDRIPDEGLTTRSWNLVVAVRRTFGWAADAVEARLANDISLEECLQRVSDAFADSVEQFARSQQQLGSLKQFVAGVEQRASARTYLATADPTSVEEVESARRELQSLATDVHTLFDEASVSRFEQLWPEFRRRYRDAYTKAHDEVAGGSLLRNRLDQLLQSEEWRRFESLSQLSIASPRFWNEANRLIEWFNKLKCQLPVAYILESQSACHCSFHLSQSHVLETLPDELSTLMRIGMDVYERAFSVSGASIADALERMTGDGLVEADEKTTRSLAASLRSEKVPGLLGPLEVHLIEKALESSSLPPYRTAVPITTPGFVVRDELRARIEQWLDDLPVHPALIEIVSEDESSNGGKIA